ncbi:MAG: aspartyl/asparaginyl beta-hydroxylase domain-containing protein [Gammaproteobacteria bacterium]
MKPSELPAFLIRRAVFWFGFHTRPLFHRFVARYSLVGNPPVFDNARFPWSAELLANWEAIRDEAQAVLRHRAEIPALRAVSPDHDRIAIDDKWQSYFIWGYGYKAGENAARCPVTTRIVERIPGLISAFFSIHAPGTHIPRHYGVTKGMLTCHLALQVPRDFQRCRIEIDGREYPWTAGGCLIFDDTYWHEVRNDTPDDRVILLVQFERPLRQPGKAISDGFLWLARHSPFIQTSLRQLGYWQDRFATAAGAAQGSARH